MCELLPHPQICKELVFPNIKKWLGGKKRLGSCEVIDAVNVFFYKNNVMASKPCWAKCVEVKKIMLKRKCNAIK